MNIGRSKQNDSNTAIPRDRFDVEKKYCATGDSQTKSRCMLAAGLERVGLSCYGLKSIFDTSQYDVMVDGYKVRCSYDVCLAVPYLGV